MINKRKELEIMVSITLNKNGKLADVGVFTPSDLKEQEEFIEFICPKKLGYNTNIQKICIDISKDLDEYIKYIEGEEL